MDLEKAFNKLKERGEERLAKQRLASMARQVAAHAQVKPGAPVVAFFNASSRLSGLSQNAAFTLLASWGARLAGARVVHFVCQAGMQPCVLGTNRDDPAQAPPCTACCEQSRRVVRGAEVFWANYQEAPDLETALQNLSKDDLSAFSYNAAEFSAPVPLGSLALPSLRWALRRYHLPDDEPTRSLLRRYILSAHSIMLEFGRFLDQYHPSVLVLFNGLLYPEAAARLVAERRGVSVITHEVSFQRFSAFFTQGDATAYPLEIPPDFELNTEQNARLDATLEQRFQGQFTMAGIRFWPEMRGLDERFLEKAAAFRQIVPVFTNVIFDTSQLHANTVFPHMFAWLDLILELMRAHPDTFFVIRAHPDEKRPGTRKQSRESVSDWVQRNGVDQLPNVLFIDSQEYVSSYELIQRSKFVLVYNSSIGLEATLLNVPVLCGGKARYTQLPTVFFPQSVEAYRQQALAFLTAENIEIPTEFQRNARRFLYYQLFRASIPFERYLEAGARPGFVRLRAFPWRLLLAENSPTMRVLTKGMLGGQQSNKTLLMDEPSESQEALHV